MNALSDSTIRNHPEGTIVAESVHFSWGIYERVVAAPGAFSESYGQYAIVMASEPIHGHIQLNGSRPHHGPTAPHSYSVLRPNDHVSGAFDTATTYEVLFLCPNYVESFIQSEVMSNRVFLGSSIRVEAPPLVQSLWRRLRDSANHYTPVAEPLVGLWVEMLIVKLVESQVGTPNPADAKDNLEAVKRAVQFIDQRLAEPINVKSIADAADLSPYYFSRIFRATYQTSVHRFVLERRLDRARQLLESSTMAISTIAFETGFSSQSHLTTAFRVRFGNTPAQFRSNSSRTAKSS